MTAPIVKHGNWEDNYDDPSHPIPATDVLDIEAIKKVGGADLMIIVATPLLGDERSQRRLLDKIKIYLKYLKTPEFQEKAGIASFESTSIIIRIHAESDTVIFDLIEKCKPWVRDNNASLRMEILGQSSH